MEEKSKYDVMCVERGDMEYLRHVAAMLLSDVDQMRDESENIAKALLGIANAAYELDSTGLNN